MMSQDEQTEFGGEQLSALSAWLVAFLGSREGGAEGDIVQD